MAETLTRKGATLELQSNQRMRDYCNWVKKHGKNPKRYATDDIERKLAKWMRRKIEGIRGVKGGALFFSSDQEIATSLGYPDIFDSPTQKTSIKKAVLKEITVAKKSPGKLSQLDKRIRDKSTSLATEYCAFIDEYKRQPTKASEDETERKLAGWLANKLDGSSIIYTSDRQIMADNGYARVLHRTKEYVKTGEHKATDLVNHSKGLERKDIAMTSDEIAGTIKSHLLSQEYWENFIEVYQTSPDVYTACEELKLRKADLKRRSSYLRRKGVNLKTFQVGPRVDFDSLAILARKKASKKS